jgi:hypothetical protein
VLVDIFIYPDREEREILVAMFDDYYCSRCGAAHKWEQMTSTAEGNLFCPACSKLLDPNNEAKRKCPVDGAEMQKRLVADLVLIDKCSACGGTWFDKGELDVIRKRSEDDGWGKGFFWGWLLG